MITIKDVAKRADVAPSTVSRVISNHPAISEKTRDKVRRVMDEMGYMPNVSARRLVTKQSNTIGLLLKTASKEMTQNPFFTDVLMSISKVCKDNHYSTVVSTSMNEQELLSEVSELVNSNAVDGFILLYSKSNDPVVSYLQSINFPFVILGKKLSPLSNEIYIDNDNVMAAYQLTDYMINLGHKNIVFIAENSTYAVNEDRVLGYSRACQQAGLMPEVFEGAAGTEEVSGIIAEIKTMLPRPTAIITSDSMMNLNVLSELYQQQLRIPDDIQTATFNDSYFNESACPPQTVVNIYPESLGAEAGSSLIEYLNHPEMIKRSIIIPTSIIERSSTKPLKERVL
ncbi:LacI family transcriptional regulator [Macrococcus equipercicus]|uniref:LacI family transcriptional regulator n=1 Tax=Macrococcus equipercicus TaxID=69967 RepID=A0ABQ6R930_9STAP|nr:LacI family DNA-binding transcriptional regulator [Macrococcus equipercicus]KAA1039654.1 LacI family transcriptional regulator [Macrococcus equipercicus]